MAAALPQSIDDFVAYRARLKGSTQVVGMLQVKPDSGDKQKQ